MDKFFYSLETFLKKQVSRGSFLKICFVGLLAVVSSNSFLKAAFAKTAETTGRPKKNIKCSYDIAVAEGPDPYQNTVKAVESLGGMGLFVKKGNVVVVKPNIGWDRTPEQAANTDPNVVAALVDMCYKAGAKRVNVFDVTCNEENRCYERSGIAKAAKEKGANVYYPNHWNVMKAKFSYKSPMEGWPILRDAIDCDVLINVPVLKSHGLTGLTLSIKNLMGICSGSRGLMHLDIGRKLTDLADLVRPELTVIDATRFLKRNGPSGGNLGDVVVINKVVASADMVLADAFACSLVGIDPAKISYIKESSKRGLGSMDVASAKKVNIKA